MTTEGLLKFRLFTYTGDPVDDHDIFARLPALLGELLKQTNGFVAYRGGLHFRGAVKAPGWHALRTAWEGPRALHRGYDYVEETDVPFAQDALGDQYLLRDDVVMRLWSETGDVESLGIGLGHFMHRVQAVPYQALNIQPFVRFLEDGGVLAPGQLLRADPPFCLLGEDESVSLSAIDAGERLATLAALCRTLQGRPINQSGVDLLEMAARRRGGL